MASHLSLIEKVSGLSNPKCYAQKPGILEVMETHMSWVFLTETDVYKLKKPVKMDVLDFSTLALRRRYCQEEVEINRTLAQGVYLGVESLNLDEDGQLHLGGPGEVVDWLVHMRRLPWNLLLDDMIRCRTIDWQLLDKAITRLCQFYSQATAADMSEQLYLNRYAQGIEYNKGWLLQPQYELESGQIEAVAAAQQDFLENQSGLLIARLAEHRIIEAHGDLRPGHICLMDPPVMIDRLEFNRNLRLLDPVDELAYLGVECEQAGAPQIGGRCLRLYLQQSGDRPPEELFHFYRMYRAFLRARQAVTHLIEDPGQKRNNWLAQAQSYINQSERYVRQLSS